MTTPSRTTKTKHRRTRKAPPGAARPAGPTTKLESLAALLSRPGGATIAEMMAATGWQQHSVRGALAGALKRHGLAITSEKVGGVRRYKGRTA